jgi:hypothetical protein
MRQESLGCGVALEDSDERGFPDAVLPARGLPHALWRDLLLVYPAVDGAEVDVKAPADGTHFEPALSLGDLSVSLSKYVRGPLVSVHALILPGSALVYASSPSPVRDRRLQVVEWL